MKRPLVFIDIDNTLAARNTEATDERELFAQCAQATVAVCDAIQRAAEHGAMIMLCTGRPRCGIVQQILDLPIAGMVCCSGAWAELDGEVVHEQWLPLQLVEKLVGAVEDSESFALFESNELVCIFESRPSVEHHISCARSMDDLRALVPSLKFSKLIVPDKLANIIRANQQLAPMLTVLDAAGGANEVTLPSINKRTGIEAILTRLGQERIGTVYGIGDSENDIALFEAVDVPIAMGSAPDSLKKLATWVAPDVWHDGVIDALAHVGLT